MIEKKVASDLQIYQLLSSIKTDSPFYLPQDLTQSISINAHRITILRCYKKYGAYLNSASSLLHFIKTQAEAEIDSTSTVNILKTCFAYGEKSLCTIKNKSGETAFHAMVEEPDYGYLKTNEIFNYCMDVLCQVAGEDIVKILRIQDCEELTAWQHAIYFAHSEVVKKFITISGDRKEELIFMNINGTALDLARLRREYLLTWISMPEYSTCVFKYWTQINELNIIIELLESYYKKPSN